MHPFDVLVLTPCGASDPALAIAASRAGARGVLDLEFTADSGAAWEGLERLERFAAGPFGVKLGPEAGPLVERLVSEPFERLAWVVLAGGDHPDLARWVEVFRQRHLTILFEAVNAAEMALGERLGADGLILKGHEAGGRVGSETAFILVQRWQRLQ